MATFPTVPNAPYAIEDHSDDGGMTWSHETWWPMVGPKKNYINKFVLQRQGSSYNRVYRWRCSEATSFTLVSAHATVTFEP